MKKYFISLIFFILSISAFSQIVTVLENTSLQPIVNAAIFSNSPKASVITDLNGQADLLAFKGADSIYFQCTGFQQKIMSYMQLEAKKFTVLMTEKVYDLNTVVISARKFEEKLADVPQQIQVIQAKQVEFENEQTAGGLLQQSGNVLVQKSQMGGGSPIIRGFEANKVLMVVDGVRMNNAIYRGGHLQNIITIDNSMLDKVEIVFGPGSVMYGSDALGGVMHFYTKNPVLSESDQPRVNAGAFLRYSSANSEKTGHVDFNVGSKKLGLTGSFNYSDFGDLRQGNVRNPYYGDWGKQFYYAGRINGQDTMLVNKDINIQKPTGYKQYDALLKGLFKQNEKVSHVLNFQYSNSSDIPRYDRLTQLNSDGVLSNAQWYYGPQKRLMAAYTLALLADRGIYSNARIVAAYQNIEESRHNRKFGSSKLNHRIEKLNILTLNADFSKVLGENEIRYGIEGMSNNVNSTANLENISTGEISQLDTRYPDGGSVMQTFAAYVTHSIEISPKFILSEGIRYSYIYLNSKFNDTTFFPFPFKEVTQKNGALNGNLGLVVMPGYDWRFTLMGSTGFRAPNVDDLSKVFESIPGSVIVPNPDLKPEYTYNAEVGISKIIYSRIRLEGTAYYTIYKDAITSQRSTFNGQDSIYYDGSLSQVMTSVNARKAYIYGFSGSISADITDNFSILSTLNYTYGRIKTDTADYPLDHIPPVFGKTSFNLNIKKFRGEFYVMYNGWKRLKDYNQEGEDNLNNATQYGSPAWYTLNIKGAYQINKYLQIQLGLENILDQNYRIFASGISAPGRNFIVSLRGRF